MSKDPVSDNDRGGALVGPRIPTGAKRPRRPRASHHDASSKLAVVSPTANREPNAGVERFPAGLAGAATPDGRAVRGPSTRDRALPVGGVGSEKAREALARRRR